MPYTTGHLFVPDGEIPAGIEGGKLNLKELFVKFFRSKSTGLVSASFLGALLLFFVGKETIVKDFLTELYRNLTVEVLSTHNDSMLRFEALADVCAEINVRLANSIFANQKRARLDMKKQAEEISKKYDFFDDNNDDKKPKEEIDKKKPYFDEPYFPDDVVIDQERDGEIEDKYRETIPYVSPRRENDNEIDEKLYKEPKAETTVNIEKQDRINKEKIIRTELEINKANIEASKDAEIKKIQDVLDEVKQDDPIETFVIDDNDLFDHDDISEDHRRFIMDIIDRTTFIADAERFVQDAKAAEMGTTDSVVKHKMEKQKQDSINEQEKNETAVRENSLMGKVRVKSEFEKEAKKLRKQTEKNYINRVKKRMGEYYGEKRTKKPPKSRENNTGEIEFKNEQENEPSKRKTPKKEKPEISLHPHERKKTIEANMAKINSAKILAKSFDLTLIHRNI